MPRIILYSMNNCPHCVTAKNYFEKKNIAYRLCNVKTPAGQKEFRKTGLRSVPAVKIADKIFAGFAIKQIENALDL
ncbi:glutaredoxin family protein [Colwelliaceae bacterium 6441]